MRVLSILIIICLTWMNSSFAQSIQGEIFYTQNLHQVKEGDFLEATIRVWPIENADLTQFRKIEKTILFNSLYVAEITSLGVSQNNSDVVEINAVLVVQSAKPQPVTNIKYNDEVINLKLGSLAVTELNDDFKDFYILDQSLNKSIFWKIALALLILLVVISVLKRRAIKEYIVGLRPNSTKKSKKNYKEIFNKANNREDYEQIYQHKDIWMNLLDEKVSAHYEFLKIINLHQFKKMWSSSDLEEVKNSFEIIRRSFDK